MFLSTNAAQALARRMPHPAPSPINVLARTTIPSGPPVTAISPAMENPSQVIHEAPEILTADAP
jgi:hypothetical protein